MINFIESILIIISTIIGLGVFVLPYAFVHSGFYFWVWFLLVVMSFFLLHLIYSEIIFQVKEKHNLPGLAGKILGEKFKKYVWVLDFFGTQLVFWAYLLAIPAIINSFFAINPLLIKIFIALFVILIIFLKINPFAKVESTLAVLLLLLFIFLISIFLPQVDFKNIQAASFNPFISYGVLIFAFTGYSSLQIVYDLIGENKKKMLAINLIALFLISLIYLLFTIAIVGIVGENISPETFSSLKNRVDIKILTLAGILAFLNIFTTFIALAFYLKRGLNVDFGLSESKSWVLTSLPILCFIFLNLENLAKLISAIGSLFIGLNLIIVLLCYLKLKEKKYFKIPNALVYLMLIFYVVGFIVGILGEFLS